MTKVSYRDYAIEIAENLYKLMAYKDEYEVARLYSDSKFKEQLAQQFEGNLKLKISLAPPLLSRRDCASGKVKKIEFGAWIFLFFKVLKRLKFLRGSLIDPFGHSAERRLERALIEEYQLIILAIKDDADPDIALMLAKSPQNIRGFGHIKLSNIKMVKLNQKTLLAKLYAQ